LYDANVHVAGSVGIAMLPEHASTPDDLLRHADVAMYAAKASASGVALYRPEDARATHRRLQLAGDLHAAIEQHQFQVFYQPQAEAATGRVAGAEALLRWHHPEYGEVPPTEMVALAQRTGLLRRLTDAILEDTLHQRAVWAALGYPLWVSVNLSARDVFDDELPRVVQRLLAATETPPSALTLEITESGVMSDPERSLAVLESLAGLGVRISVDDFGTGHSSLAYLERLPVHEVKIDKSFVQRLDADASDATVIRSTIALAHELGMTVVAEGVESAAVQERIAALGCEFVQGYVISRPLPAHETIPWIRARANAGGLHPSRG
jgi:EAL domain-containing protein (putative c-di-GMP-specific phosphodiesterase class I)